MVRYIGRRLLQMIPILLVVAILVFLLMEFVPGDPVKIILGDSATEAQIEEVRETMGFNDPFFVRFFDFFTHALRLDFGSSYITGTSVGAELLTRFPKTFKLALFSVLVTVIVGVPIGIMCAINANKLSDRVWLVITLLANSMPSFWLALLLVLLFSLHLKWLPSSGIGSWKNYVLPIVSSSVGSLASIARQTRSSMLEVIRADYITTARSKGLKERSVIIKHALPNALIPIITVIGGQFSYLMGGTTIIESVYSFPGLGSYIISGINNRDYPIVRGGILYIAFTFSIMMLIVDIIYAFADPRIRAQYAASGKKKKSEKQ
ncbi:MAG: ABC transporter permease [Eisenbergiella tayi]|uniref:Glutathione transport system permease protein GsiC n=1 Tax=Eisenbergiella tayi TaxID=1432052 RepID=A0A1E3A986_9FIRM|nr:ABC transporter permease [Eisenbergiella tayi]ODM04746.1 Glutathione transport system permease protein GsiC [Eisenbergiella tayi]